MLFLRFRESIGYLFLNSPFAKMVWLIVQFTSNLRSSTNITNMLRNWLNGVEKKTKARIRIGISASCWVEIVETI